MKITNSQDFKTRKRNNVCETINSFTERFLFLIHAQKVFNRNVVDAKNGYIFGRITASFRKSVFKYYNTKPNLQ